MRSLRLRGVLSHWPEVVQLTGGRARSRLWSAWLQRGVRVKGWVMNGTGAGWGGEGARETRLKEVENDVH